jgi:mRNA-degrading endonuclease toxin of MazEF toxin-antitoxin module
MIIKRGYIYLAALDPVVGNKIAKTRPVDVISNDVDNKSRLTYINKNIVRQSWIEVNHANKINLEIR